MKKLFYYSFVTILIALSFSSCSTYQYELGSMSTKDQAAKISLLNKEEKRQMQMQKVESRRESNSQDNLLAKADKNSLLRIKESRSNVVEAMSQQNEKKNIRVKSYDGYEAAYFYQAVNASNSVAGKEGSQMNLLLMNKTRKRPSYSSTDPYSMEAKVYLVEPKKAKPGFKIEDAKVIRQVSSVRLEAEGKKVIKLPIGFYIVNFVHNGKTIWTQKVTLLPDFNVSVSAEDLRGTGFTSQDIDNFAYALFK